MATSTEILSKTSRRKMSALLFTTCKLVVPVMLKNHLILGCKEQDQCGNTTSCPIRTPNDVCWKYGCCNYNSCAVIYTLGKYFEVSPSSSAIKPAMVKSSPTSAIEPSSPAVKPSSPAVKPSSPAVEPSSPAVASSFVARMTTKPEMAATSSFQAKMTTKPMMPTTKMSEVKPMMSSQPDGKPTESKKGMMSSSEKVKPSPTGSDAVRKTETLETPSPVDNRPTCGSGQVFSTVVVIAIGLFCTIF